MDDEANQPRTSGTNWTQTQTYVMAAVCLVIGVLVGYLVRGSAHPAAQAPPAEMQQATSAPAPAMQQATSVPPGMGQRPMPTLDDMKRMTDKQAEPLLAKLKTDPKNVDLLNKIALTYKAGHQFKEAIAYFQKSLDVDPKNVTIRTVMASCMYYTGDVDGALAELNKSLTYDPKHAGTLMNIGIIKWHGKNDINGAVAAWQTLLKLNPNFPQKEVIEHLITEAKQQQSTASAATPGKG
jgi:Tfp pilus assembly protein PilF